MRLSNLSTRARQYVASHGCPYVRPCVGAGLRRAHASAGLSWKAPRAPGQIELPTPSRCAPPLIFSFLSLLSIEEEYHPDPREDSNQSSLPDPRSLPVRCQVRWQFGSGRSTERPTASHSAHPLFSRHPPLRCPSSLPHPHIRLNSPHPTLYDAHQAAHLKWLQTIVNKQVESTSRAGSLLTVKRLESAVQRPSRRSHP